MYMSPNLRKEMMKINMITRKKMFKNIYGSIFNNAEQK